MTQPFWISTSWDDGHVLDRRVVDLLNRHNLRGTFYIARDYLPDRLSDSEIVVLAQEHEVAAHTLTHPILTEIALDDARQEIMGSKAWLEDLTGRPVTGFAFPAGIFNQDLRNLAEDVGFRVARSVRQFSIGTTGLDYLDLPTTIHIYPFPFRPVNSWRARFQPIRRAVPHILPLRIPLLALRNWPALATILLERASQQGGVWHLWGHSWEIEKYGMWDELDRILAVASRYSNAQPVTNSELVHALKQQAS
ncbi:MAG: polysaccharide deacetylase family protein [Chloroflexi bacterium]|nr:polysaccharide deacetylase family protein [Chloroflexota bacterium]